MRALVRQPKIQNTPVKAEWPKIIPGLVTLLNHCFATPGHWTQTRENECIII